MSFASLVYCGLFRFELKIACLSFQRNFFCGALSRMKLFYEAMLFFISWLFISSSLWSNTDWWRLRTHNRYRTQFTVSILFLSVWVFLIFLNLMIVIVNLFSVEIFLVLKTQIFLWAWIAWYHLSLRFQC